MTEDYVKKFDKDTKEVRELYGIPSMVSFMREQTMKLLNEFYTGTPIDPQTQFTINPDKYIKEPDGPYVWKEYVDDFEEDAAEDGGKIRGRLLKDGRLMILISMYKGQSPCPMYATIHKERSIDE